MPSAYVPEKGDLVAVDFDPQSGHEQRGRRPALVVSNNLFNLRTGLAPVCPITNTNRNLPFHVALPAANTVTGYVMVEQVKAIDYRSRQARFIERSAPAVLEKVLSLLHAFVF